MTTPDEGMFVGSVLFAESDDALLLVTDPGVIENANAAAARLFGYDVGGLDGMEIASLIPESARSHHAAMVKEHFGAPEIRLHGVRALGAVRSDGSEFVADVFLFPFTRGGQKVVLVGVFDLAEQMEIDRTTEGIRSIRERVGDEGDAITLEECRSLVRQACDLSLHALSRSAEAERYDKDFWLGFTASQQVSEGSRFARLFESMPLAMWESDYSEVETWFAARRGEGVHDLGTYFDAHPESLDRVIAMIRIRRSNRAAVDAALYVGEHGFSDPQALPPTLRSILRERLIGFFEGRSVVESEIHEEDPDLGVQSLLVTAWVREGEGGQLDLSSVFSSLVDIQHLNQLEMERQIALEQFEVVFNNASAGITLLNPENGTFVRANRAFTNMLGYPEGDLDGIHLSKITPASALKDLERYISPEDCDDRGVAVFERPYLQRDGGIRWGRVSTRRPDRTGSEAALAVAVITDITDVRSEQLARSKAEEILRRKSTEFETFAWRSAHDLSEPLRKIRVFGERLVDTAGDSLDDRSRDYLDRMTSAAERMQDLIDGLLEYSRVASGAQPFEWVDLADIARSVVADLEVAVSEAGAKVEIGDLPRVMGEPTQLRQLFQNLISNSLKYRSPDDDSSVIISSEISSKHTLKTSGAVCRIIVEDRGIGIPEQHIEAVFDLFTRLHTVEEYPGAGLGLSICRRIVEHHRGLITIEPNLPTGTRVFVTLPIMPERGV